MQAITSGAVTTIMTLLFGPLVLLGTFVLLIAPIAYVFEFVKFISSLGGAKLECIERFECWAQGKLRALEQTQWPGPKGCFAIAAIIFFATTTYNLSVSKQTTPPSEEDQFHETIAAYFHETTAVGYDLEIDCRKGREQCEQALLRRTLQINSDQGSGTAFILESTQDEQRLVLLTASHVIRTGNGKNSSFFTNLQAYDPFLNSLHPIVRGCAFFTKQYGDIGIIEISTNRRTRYKRPRLERRERLNQKVLLAHHRDDVPVTQEVEFVGSILSQGIGFYSGITKAGYSGSGVITKSGSLIGIVYARLFDQAGVVTPRLDFVTANSLDYIIAKESDFTPYTCLNSDSPKDDLLAAQMQ